MTINPPETVRRLRALHSHGTGAGGDITAAEAFVASELPEITVKYILRVAGGEAPRAMALTLNGAMQSGSFLTDMKTSYPDDELTIRGSFSELTDETQSPSGRPTGSPTLSPTPQGELEVPYITQHSTALDCTAVLHYTSYHHTTLLCSVQVSQQPSSVHLSHKLLLSSIHYHTLI